MSDLIDRLRKRAEIRRQIPSRKSVQEGKPDRIADLLEEAADALEHRQWVSLTDDEGAQIWGDAHDINWDRLITPKEIVQRISDKLREKNT